MLSSSIIVYFSGRCQLKSLNKEPLILFFYIFSMSGAAESPTQAILSEHPKYTATLRPAENRLRKCMEL